MRLFPVLATTLLMALPATAQPTPAPAAAPATAAAPAKEKKICRDEGETGSLLTKRVCHTKAEWAAIDAANGHTVDAIRARNMATGTGF